MAGIGFELKKLFNKKGLLPTLRAYIFSSVVTVGPTIIFISLIFLMQAMLYWSGVSFADRQLVMGAVTYSFIFSQIITSGFSMLITRYVSDRIFTGENNEIMPSLYGITTLCVAIGGTVGIVFYFKAPLQLNFKFAAYAMLVELIVMWLQMVYLSALKNFWDILKGFFYGFAAIFICFYVFVRIFKANIILSCLVSIDIGFLIMLVMLGASIRNYLTTSEGGGMFKFIKYFDNYSNLFIVNFFYIVGLYIHNIIFWFGRDGIVVKDTYRMSPFYDTIVFYAFLSMLPAMVLFIVRVETTFYDTYKKYYQLVVNGARLNDIQKAKELMINTVWQEIRNLAEIQGIISVLYIIAGYIFLPNIGLTWESVNIFAIMVLGALACIMMFIVILLLLYYDDRKGAMYIAVGFAVMNAGFTIITICIGESLYGFGFFMAAVISFLLALLRLSYYLKRIDYYTFCAQPIFYVERKGPFTWIYNKVFSKYN